MSNFKELMVWQKAIELVVTIYKITKKFPKEEMYGLVSQMQRAAVSIPSNIAEGHERNSDKEFAKFLCVSRGSLGELETQLIIAERLNYVSEEYTNKLLTDCYEIGKMLNALIKKIKSEK